MMFKYFNLKNPYFYIPLFLIFFIYFVLRAVYVNPFCDETFTFYEYVETGIIWEDSPNFSSANNHLLATFIARFFYSLFGNKMFLFRLISLIAFVIYFFIGLKLIGETIKNRFNFIVFLGLISIGWIDDFFSYARGYAIALSLFLTCIYLLIKWKNNFKIKWYIVILILSWLTVFANLAYLNSIFVLIGYSIVILILNFKKNTKQNNLIHFSFLILFLIALLPLINYSFALKNSGAFWWGNHIDWWTGTIDYLIELTFFYSSDNFFYPFLLIFLGLIIWTITKIIKDRFLPFIHSNHGLITFLFFGHIVLTELLVQVFGVNYPSDRVAMIYVILCLILIGFIFDSYKKLNFLSFLYLFFPLTFIVQLNLDTSTYMGHTRISAASFEAIKNEIKFSKSIDMDGLNYMNYTYKMRNQKTILLANRSYNEDYPIICFSKYISDINDHWQPSKFHKLVYSEPQSNARLYRYIKKYDKNCVFDTTFTYAENNYEFYNLIHEKIVSQIAPSRTYQISINGSVFFKERPKQYNLVYASKNNKTDPKMYNTINLINYCEFNEFLNFEWESPVYTSDQASDKFTCYFWNPELKKIQLENIKIQIFELIE